MLDLPHKFAGVKYNPDLEFNVYKHFGGLYAYEDGWDRLDFDFSQTVAVLQDPSGIYNLLGCDLLQAAVEGGGRDLVEEA